MEDVDARLKAMGIEPEASLDEYWWVRPKIEETHGECHVGQLYIGYMSRSFSTEYKFWVRFAHTSFGMKSSELEFVSRILKPINV